MTEKVTTKKRGAKTLTFEEQMAKLETLVGKLESGGLGLEASIAAYEEAMGLIRALDKQLDEGEKKLTALQNGQLQPFAAEDIQ